MNLVLTLHLLGAATSLALIFSSIYVVLRKKFHFYLFFIKALALNSIFQVVTGVGVFLTSNNQSSVLGFCARIGIYLAVILFVQGVLYMQMKHRFVRIKI